MNHILRGGRRGGALLLGVSLVLALPAPASAKKKQDTAGYGMGDAFRAAARAVQSALGQGDLAGAGARIGELQALAQNPQEKYAAAALRLQLGARQNDAAAQRKALTAMLESGGAPAADIPYLHYLAGYFSYQLNDMNDALTQLSYARQMGYSGPQATLLLADANIRMGKGAEGLALVREAMAQQRAAGGRIGEPWYDRAAAISYKGKDWAGLAGWYRMKLADYPSPENWRSAIVNYLANPALSGAMKLDLYRLLSAAGALVNEQDYQDYAAAAVENGQYGEAKALIEAGRANGRLPAADKATAAIYKTASARAATEKAGLAARAAKAPLEAADTYFALGDYAKAIPLYRTALGRSPADTSGINTRLGIALARTGAADEGQKMLAAVTGPWFDIAQFWLLSIGQQGTRPPAAG